MYKRQQILTAFVMLSLTFCKSAYQVAKPVNKPTDIHIYEVNLEKLINRIGDYHGKTVQTSGLFFSGFETSELRPAAAVLDSNTQQFNFRIKSLPGIWVIPDLNRLNYDSLEKFISNKNRMVLITLQGTIDSSKTGHMGCCAGAIVNARVLIKD